MLSEFLKTEITTLSRRCGAGRVVLFGSRARGDHRTCSDIDLAVFGLPQSEQWRFWDGVDELPTLLKIDVVFVSEHTDPKLLENIERDGVVLMSKLIEKYEKYQRAVLRLQEIIEKYDECGMEELKDGVIQRFSFSSELAWKTSREYLLEQGYTDINSPKSVMQCAYADGLIADDAAWIALLKARNLAAHIYDEAEANEIFKQIRTQFLPLLRQLEQTLSQKM